MDCIFCKIIDGEIPSQKVYEDDKILAFKDIAPMANVHVVIIPKKHIESCNEINGDNASDIGYLFTKIPFIAEKVGVSKSGYRIVTNCGDDSWQSVKHIHFHMLGGEKLSESLC